MRFRTAFVGCLAGCLMATATSAQAETKVPKTVGQPLVARMDFVQLSDQAIEKFQESSRVVGDVTEQSGVRLLQTSEMLILSEDESQVHFGQKFPLIYFDPRGSSFQVNFVDTGIKFDLTCRAQPDQTFQIDLIQEVSELESKKPATNPIGGSYPQTIVFKNYAKIARVHFAESVVVTRVCGTSARNYLTAMGVSGGDDNLLLLVTLTKP